MEHPSLATAPHPCFRLLAILLVGNAKERNGTLMATDTYCAKFGMTSHGTVQRSREQLEQRGLIVCTRRVQRMKRWPALWAVTWWPIYYRDGQPINPPQPAPHTYLNWQPITPTRGVKSRAGKNAAADFPSPLPEGHITPTIGVQNAVHHPDLTPFSGFHHPSGRGDSRSRTGVDASDSAHSPKSLPQSPSKAARALSEKNGGADSKKDDERIRKARKHLTAAPGTDNAILARMYGLSADDIQQLRAPG